MHTLFYYEHELPSVKNSTLLLTSSFLLYSCTFLHHMWWNSLKAILQRLKNSKTAQSHDAAAVETVADACTHVVAGMTADQMAAAQRLIPPPEHQ